MLSLDINKQKGIALIQVLIIAIILTMLGIFINQSVRNQVKTAQLIQDNHKLNLLLESAEAELMHTLLTQKRYRNINSDNELVQHWNFHGEKFHVNDQVTIQLQDLNGLLSLNYMNNTLSTRLLEQLGHNGHNARTFLDSLKDWKDKDDLKHLNGAERVYYNNQEKTEPRNDYLQSLSEVKNIKGAEILTQIQWKKYYSIALVSKYNPLNSPVEILKAFLKDEEIVEQVVNQRSQGTLNSVKFYQLAGVEEDESITFFTGKMININITVNIKNNKLSKSFQVELRPYTRLRPVIISNIKWNE